MKLGAVVMTFDRPLLLKENIQLLLEQTYPPDLILVIDNGCLTDTRQVVQSFAHDDVSYHAMGDNLGPAGAGAYGLKQLIEYGCSWIYWGGDDNPPQVPDALERLLKLTNQEDVGAVGAVGTLWDWKKGKMERLPDQALQGIISVDTIGSGHQLILRKEAIQTVGLPDTRLFFGLEEIEYCLRIRNAGYRLLVDGDLMREYRARAGRLNLKRQRSLVPRHAYHTIWRQYYSTRNYIFAMNKTFQCPNLARREAFKAFGRTFFSWGRGPRYGAAFTSLQLRGVLDGYLGRMGRTVLPKPKYGGKS